jgi:hypothetical protein
MHACCPCCLQIGGYYSRLPYFQDSTLERDAGEREKDLSCRLRIRSVSLGPFSSDLMGFPKDLKHAHPLMTADSNFVLLHILMRRNFSQAYSLVCTFSIWAYPIKTDEDKSGQSRNCSTWS